MLVNAIKIICKMGIVMIGLLFLFNLEQLTVIGVWTLLLIASPFNTFLEKVLRPTLVICVSEYTKIMDKIAMEIRTILYVSGVKKESGDTMR